VARWIYYDVILGNTSEVARASGLVMIKPAKVSLNYVWSGFEHQMPADKSSLQAEQQ